MFSNKLTNAEATELAERLAEIARTDYPLPDSLRAAAKNVGNRRISRSMVSIAELLESGVSVDQAVAQSVSGIPSFLIGLLQVGAKQGKLPVVLSELTDHYRHVAAIGTQIGGALWYPVVVSMIFFVLIGFILTFVVPTFEMVFQEFDTELGAPTEILMGLSRDFLPVVVPSMAIVAASLFVAKFVMGAANWARFVQAVPAFGNIIRWHSFVELLQMLRLQVSQGVPIPDALRYSSQAIRDANLSEVAQSVAHQIENGWSLADAMESHYEIPGGVSPLIRWGEQNNELPLAIDSITELLHGRIQWRSKVLNAVIPPAMLLAIAAGSLFLVIALFGPMFGLIQNLAY